MSDYFPEEIIHKILLKLPAKSLIKFTVVSKSWKSLIKSSTFIQSHLRTTIASNDQNDSHLLLLSASSYDTSHQHHWLHWDSPDFGEHSILPTPIIFLKNKPVSDLTVVGTSNGLVCLVPDIMYSSRILTLIWNPSIRKLVMLPKPPVCFKNTKHDKYTTHAFGYDAHSNDYKILRIVTLPYDHSDLSGFATEVLVFSLARWSWRKLSASETPVDLRGDTNVPAFVNGIFHTLESRLTVYYNDHYEEDHKSGGEMFICTFNLASEEFGEVMRPEALREGPCTISRYGDSLAMIKHYYYDYRDPINRGCDIWVMKEYGVAESWTYLFNIHVSQASIYGFKKCGEVVFMESPEHGRSRMVSFDPKTNQLEGFGTEDHIYNFMDSFVESLVLLDHANAISYQVARTNSWDSKLKNTDFEDISGESDKSEEIKRLDTPSPSVSFLDIHTLKVFHVLKLGEGREITSLALNADDTNLLVSTADKQLLIFMDPALSLKVVDQMLKLGREGDGLSPLIKVIVLGHTGKRLRRYPGHILL